MPRKSKKTIREKLAKPISTLIVELQCVGFSPVCKLTPENEGSIVWSKRKEVSSA